MMPRAPMSGGDPRDSAPREMLDQAQRTGYPVVAGQHVRRDRGGLMMAAGIAMLLGGVTFFTLSSHRNQPPVIAAPAVAQAAPPPVASVAPLTAPAPVAVLAQTAPVVPVTGPNRYGASTLVYDSMGVAGPVTASSTAAPVAAPPAAHARATSPGLNPDESFAQQLNGNGDNQPAKPMASPAATVAQGTMMPAVLETAIDTDVPGFVRAVISRDVRSFDGSRVLVPRSSHVIGQYKSAPAQGQSRVYVLWTRLIRPDGVSIDLGSPTTDSSGRNGLGGQVNSHFGKRFGAAILLSTIGAAGQAIGGGGNTAVILAGPQNAMSGATQGSANIPPTIRVAQGQPILIFTAHDLDFSSVAP
jgi:type IV secretion system protein VirB10